jgi:pyruvate, water dikinase
MESTALESFSKNEVIQVMMNNDENHGNFIDVLKERVKELNTLYKIQEVLNNSEISLKNFYYPIVEIIPQGWQYPEICEVELVWKDEMERSFTTPGFIKTPWVLSSEIIAQGKRMGRLSVYYTEPKPEMDEGPFFKEERTLLNSIAEQIGSFILHQQLKYLFEREPKPRQVEDTDLVTFLDLLERTEPGLLLRISKKMLNQLCWQGVDEARQLLERLEPGSLDGIDTYTNRPFQQETTSNMFAISNQVFAIASQSMPREIILENIQSWFQEERSGFLMDILEDPGSSLSDIITAVQRYRAVAEKGVELTKPRTQWLLASLIRRILSEQAQFVDIAKRHISVDRFAETMGHIIYQAKSHGKLGGKSSGLILASQILKNCSPQSELLKNVKTPKTWYITSDSILYFLRYNHMEDVVEQKYKDISQVRQEYPYIAHMFKNSPLPHEISLRLSLALDDFGNVPLIVRSSSLLEDQVGLAFAGKYKSLFIANRGSKEERLVALSGAITEVYASLFSPDPIEYRKEHNLMDYHEEMSVMIQEVVGKQVGRYFLPAFAGVAFSNNEFRWSNRIKRDDGLVRLVPGLGTRAVDRLSHDYPLLVSPGQPGLRVNVTQDEIIYYSPKKIDVINLESGQFETIDIRALLKEFGPEYPMINQMVSILKSDYIQSPLAYRMDFEQDQFVVTFENLLSKTPFLKQIKEMLTVLQSVYGHPVDIEFAHNGQDFYLLQCRAQSSGEDYFATPIPQGIPKEKIIFSANRFISNGDVPEITHIVYVDPMEYAKISEYQDLVAIGRAVGRLNQVLPKRKFILMGPGRWGSSGDIKLGVSVTYSNIKNTAMLIEIARKKKEFVPDLSFGTHFFLDLVEASIRYLPLYPDEANVNFNEEFLAKEKNLLAEILPEYAQFSNVIHVIDVPASANGQILKVILNGDEEKAVAYLAQSTELNRIEKRRIATLQAGNVDADVHWRWRMQAVENIGANLDSERFGVKGLYVIGSTKNATAGPQSDIDLLIHFQGTEEQKKELLTWLEGWELCLDQANYLRTGLKIGKVFDVHFVTDEDIQKPTSFASKIGAVTDAAMPLIMGTAIKNSK